MSETSLRIANCELQIEELKIFSGGGTIDKIYFDKLSDHAAQRRLNCHKGRVFDPFKCRKNRQSGVFEEING